jgi:hypothetical protein
MVYWAGWDLDWRLFAAVGIGLALFAIQWVVNPEFRRQHFHWRHGWWVLLWFAGLIIVSWQGIYSSDDKPHGQQNNLGFGWAFLVLAAWSLLIYVLAIRSRFSPEQTRAQIERTPTDEPPALAEV